MFFILSKIFSFLFSPLSWVFLLIIISYFLKNKQKRKRLLYTAVIILYLFSNNTLYYKVDSFWGKPSLKIPVNKCYPFAIVPGGMANFDDNTQRIRFSCSADRLMQAIYLYKKGVVNKILISGGSGNLLYPEMRESEIILNYLIEIGIPKGDVFIENKSRNTHENAFFTSKILRKYAVSDTCLLITSAIHMRRAEACFRKEGVKVIPYATSQLIDKYEFSIDNMFLPKASVLNSWQQLLHEIAGFVIYWVREYV